MKAALVVLRSLAKPDAFLADGLTLAVDRVFAALTGRTDCLAFARVPARFALAVAGCCHARRKKARSMKALRIIGLRFWLDLLEFQKFEVGLAGFTGSGSVECDRVMLTRSQEAICSTNGADAESDA